MILRQDELFKVINSIRKHAEQERKNSADAVTMQIKKAEQDLASAQMLYKNTVVNGKRCIKDVLDTLAYIASTPELKDKIVCKLSDPWVEIYYGDDLPEQLDNMLTDVYKSIVDKYEQHIGDLNNALVLVINQNIYFCTEQSLYLVDRYDYWDLNDTEVVMEDEAMLTVHSIDSCKSGDTWGSWCTVDAVEKICKNFEEFADNLNYELASFIVANAYPEDNIYNIQ